MSCYIYQLPSWVLDDLCRNMDTLSEWDWMQFASYVITDLTQLRKIKSMERVQGVSITRELLWWWGMRQATVQQLVDLLRHLQLYRAAQIILNWKPVSELKSPIPFPDTVKPVSPLAASVRNAMDEQEKGQPVQPATLPGPGSAAARASQQFFLLPLSEEDAPHSLKTSLPTSSDSKDFSTSPPKQEEKLLNLAGDSLLWSEADVIQATNDFNQNHKISEGTFAVVYRGQRHGTPFVFKKLREAACSSSASIERFFQVEVQVCLSSNVLLDQNFTPKLAHPVAHLCPVNKRSKYTMMKTHLFQASAAYLPEDFIRVGQLTKRVDVFSCGIVLAEVLTGMAAMDKDRSPVFLKDLLLREIPSSTTSSCSRKMDIEKVMAKEICRKYVEKRAGKLPEDCAEALAAAACLCLRKRNASLAEVCGSVAAVEERLRGQETSLPWSGLSKGTGTSSNTPEETDDVDNSSLDAAPSRREASWVGAASSPLPTEEGQGRLRASGEMEADSPSEACASQVPPQDASTETSWKIEINEAKRKLMENILLYKEKKLDSVELFGP
ncbi:interleukin-1 receptor-associated kinase-like 2 isoform X3 [Elephas maximus indicus]|uniref:interleukin-1 receptor-associated kinase-like 2 isoform X3 n=1 Tax=Elephas maximus indicus TaxID=99487 RepID=UPI0021165EC2|nr:interleukin-1 receptor-associated kinase-like 2 isoform X3 [Elephas maximus indicus]